MQVNEESAEDVRGRAREFIRLGRLEEARGVASAFIEAEGADAGVFLALGEAHAAEDDDEHDDLAERAYQRGLAAFPDDVGLLTAYARLCLTSDVNERPRRFDRGPALAARVRELAPDSAHVRSLTSVQRGPGRNRPPKGPSSYRVQTHDLRWALKRVPDRAVAIEAYRAAAAAHPADVRRQVLAHTLAAFERPVVARLLPIVVHPRAYGLVHAACLIALLVGRVRWGNSAGALGLVLVGILAVSLPRLAVQRVLRKARCAAGPWPGGDFAPGLATDGVSESGLPPVPAYTARELRGLLAPLALVLVTVVATTAWSWALARQYPRYEVSAPATLAGMPLTSDGPLAELARTGATTMPEESFHLAYDPVGDGVEGIAVVGSVGDLHDARAEMVDLPRIAVAGSPDVRVTEVWRPDPGALGGWVQCLSAEAGGAVMHNCAWADKGSFGYVLLRGPALDRDRVSDLARTAREAVLHRIDD
ncbi:hypothetical protein ACIBEA_22275 [Streptomyces sp. NPDC051555]|uniref:hypothetical protein n=1 Tax=Streptomyces sp. NPDC051555 TaxID=3365657 RepID=UPI003791A262